MPLYHPTAGREPYPAPITVTRFELPPGEALILDGKEHTLCLHPSPVRFDRLFKRGVEQFHTKTGFIGIVPKGTDCAIDVQGANADVIRISVLVDHLQSVAMMAGASPANILSDQHGTDLTMLHLALAYLSEAARKTVETFSLEALSNALSVHIVARYAERREQARGTLSARRPQRVTGYVMDHITGPITLAEMAEIAGISLYHFSHVFAATMGVTPHRYIMATRVSLAVKLISTTNVRLVEIADQCGFSDQSHLSRWIKAIHGITPKQLRIACL